MHFSEIATLKVIGNNLNPEQFYLFTDETGYDKYRYVYYEFVITDKNGNKTNSAIKMFKTSSAAAKLEMQHGPNPIMRPVQLIVQFNAEHPGSMVVNVFDADGKSVLKTNLRAMAGLNNGHLHVCDLTPGIYTMQFNFEGLRETKKIVVN